MKNFLCKVDLHLHSYASHKPAGWFTSLLGCPESYTKPLEIYKRLKRKGFSYVTITDHDTIDGVLEIAHFPDVFISCEYTVKFPNEPAKVHILVYGLTEAQHQDLLKLRENIYAFVVYLKEHNLPHSLAHPLYSVEGTKITKALIEKMALLFDTWEIINGTRGSGVKAVEERIAQVYSHWDKIRELEERYRIKSLRSRERISFTAGSDDHGGLDVGRTWTAVEGAKSLTDFLRALSEGKTLIGTEKLGEERLVNTITRIGYEHVKKYFFLPEEVSNIIESALAEEENPTNLMWFKYLLGLNSDQGGLIKALVERLPFFFWERLNNHKSLQNFGLFILSLILHLLPALVKYLQKREERKIQNLGREWGLKFVKPVKVAYFTDTFWDVNGVAQSSQILRNLAIEESLPIDFYICQRETKGAERLFALRALMEISVPFYKELKMGVPSILDLINLLEREEYTHVHIATPGPLGILALLAGKILGLPVTFTFHTDIPTYARIYTQDEELETILWEILSFIGNLSEAVFVPSQEYEKILLKKGVLRSKIKRFVRGVNTELFSPAKRDPEFWSKKLGRPVERAILYVGRLAKEKNLEVFLNVAKCFPDEVFVMVGDGPYRAELEKKSPSNVFFTGYLKGEELAQAYASSFIFLFPSESETYGLVVLEAMASGLPVVVSSVGASKEHISDGINGLLARDTQEFIEKVALLLYDEEFYKKIAFEAYRRAKELDLRKTYLEYLLKIMQIRRSPCESHRSHTLLSFTKRRYQNLSS